LTRGDQPEFCGILTPAEKQFITRIFKTFKFFLTSIKYRLTNKD
jgi:hypothetical protein